MNLGQFTLMWVVIGWIVFLAFLPMMTPDGLRPLVLCALVGKCFGI